MKSHGICSPLKSSYNSILLFMIYLIGLIINNSPVKSHPSWDTQTTITDFGRNIRQLPCVSRRTGETGVCMFAYSCAKVNGTHLGTCIDRFYFGSCCKTQPGGADVEVNEPDNYLQNNLDNNDVAGGPAHVTSNARPQAAGSTGFPSSTSPPQPQSYRPTAQFAVSSSTTPSSTSTSTTSRNQYTEISNSGGSRPTYSTAGGSAGPVTSAYTTTISQSTKPVPSTTFSTARPSVKPSPYKPPPAAQTKPKPQTARPTVQFSVPSSTSPYNSPSSPYHSPSTSSSSSSSSTSSGHEVTRPATNAYSTTTTASPRPLSSTVTAAATAAFSATKPTAKPSTSTTYKSTAPPQPTTASPQKVKPQTTAAAKPATTRPTPPPPPPRPSSTPSTSARPEPSSSARPEPSSSARPEPSSTHDSATRATVEAAVTTEPTAATAAMHHGPSPTTSPGYGGSSSTVTVTSTSPTLVTWTTLDKVPAESSDNTKPPTATYKPSSLVDGSTLPSWVKLPVETHEPNTAGTPPSPPKDSSTSVHSSTSAMPKPTTTPQNPSDNDIIMTSNSISAASSSTQYPPSTLSMLTTAGTTATPTTAATTSTTDSVEDGSVPLNMSNYKEVCGRRLFPTARIVGGEKVSFGKWPWQISLRQWRTSTYLHKCGAALFNENWAVTAAHCVENVPPSDLLLRLGEHDLSVEEEPYGYEERRIQIVASHPQFDPRTFEYDLALLRFYEPVKFQPNIIPVCVPEDDSNFVSSSAYVTGWGRLYEDGPLPSVLQEVTVPVINNSVCETMYRAAGYIEHIPDIFICAGWKKGGFDSCEGDSGGPMVIQRPDKRWLLAGIISWGIGCAEPNQPGVYTRISKFKDWINQILQF